MDGEVVLPQVNTAEGFTYTPEERLAEGPHSGTARAYDQAGNQAETGPWTFTVQAEGAPSLGVTKYYYLGGQRVAMWQDDQVYYLHGDHPSASLRVASLWDRASLGSTSLTTDNSGTPVAETRHPPYGEVRWASGAQPTDFGFTGQRAEGFGLMDYRAQYYDPAVARFLNEDTRPGITYLPKSLHVYVYAWNNPILLTDSSGLQPPPPECNDPLEVVGAGEQGISEKKGVWMSARQRHIPSEALMSVAVFAGNSLPIFGAGTGWSYSLNLLP